jgi:hypothetical protein
MLLRSALLVCLILPTVGFVPPHFGASHSLLKEKSLRAFCSSQIGVPENKLCVVEQQHGQAASNANLRLRKRAGAVSMSSEAREDPSKV